MSGGKVGHNHLTPFTRQLATLIRAGLPLLRSLDILHEQVASKNLQEAIGGMKADIEAGSTFSDALSKYPKIFDRLFINMIQAGEVSGALENVLDRLSIFAEKAAGVRSKVKSALFYPVTVLIVAAVVVVIILIFVVPQFASIFTDLGAELPALTQIVVKMADIVQNKFYIPLGIVFAGIRSMEVRSPIRRRAILHRQ